MKMFGSRHEVQPNRTYNFPQTKAKNIYCVQCKRRFFASAFRPLEGLLPLILRCGHIMCERCSKKSENNACPLCETDTDNSENEKTMLPLNIYALGLMLVSYNNDTVKIDDTELSFHRPTKSKFYAQSTQGLCYECGLQATLRCPQCVVLFCSVCYTKIHGRALKNHSKMPLVEGDERKGFTIRTTCKETCNEPLRYYCNDCKVSCCSHCILQLHPKHDYISLIDKNKDLLDEFEAVSDQVAEALARICSTEKKIKSMQVFPSNMQDSKAAEASITQHFALLHGILQNLEEKLLDELNQQRIHLTKNLDDITIQLKNHEDALTSALVLTGSVKENLVNLDLQGLIDNFRALADIPCHLVQDVIPADQKVVFKTDKSIITALEKHCKLEIPSLSGFNLLSTKQVPEHHIIEPLPEKALIPKPVRQPPPLMKPSSPDVKSSSEYVESALNEGASEMIRVSHIVDPGCFYVQKVGCRSKLMELEKALQTEAPITGSVSSEVTLNKFYLVERAIDKQWCRGSVTNMKIPNEIFDVFLVDYGSTEEDVPITRMKTINPQHATLPVMALKCQLYDTVATNGKWDQSATEDFKKLVPPDSQISMRVINIYGDTYCVDLSSLLPLDIVLTSVRERMIFLKHANRVTTQQLMRMNPRSVRKYYKEKLRMEKYTAVEILSVESPSCIYVRQENEFLSLYDKLVEEMTAEYQQNTSMGFIHAPEKGLICAARNIDGYWYRGIICDTPTESTVKVFYVDFGITKEQNYDTIRALQDRFINLRAQAIKIALHKIVPPSNQEGQWSQNAIEFTKHLLENAAIIKVVPFQHEEGCYHVALYIRAESNTKDINLGNLLVKKKLAEQIGKSSPSQHNTLKANAASKKKLYGNKKKRNILNIPTDYDGIAYEESIKDLDVVKENGDPFQISVSISRAESPDCIYVSNTKCHQSYIEFKSDMQQFYTRFHSKPHTNWTKNAICAVYSNKDQQYCRAKILDVISPTEVSVFFYDLGIQEIVPMKNIQNLHPNYSCISAHVFKIKLSGILPCGGSTTWPSLSCEILNEIIRDCQHLQFFVSKIVNNEDSAVAVELWVRETKADGPFSPTRIEINSVNRMLVDRGVALPIKGYAQKRDKILAVELEQQLKRQAEVEEKIVDVYTQWYDNSDLLESSPISEESLATNPLFIQRDSENESSDSDESSMKLPQAEPRAWIPPKPILEMKFMATPTNVDNNCAIYLHPVRQAFTLRAIERKLYETYADKKMKRCDTEWSLGDLCIAQYHGNKKWYRGTVLSLLETDKIAVQFVDYGNIEECTIGSLKKKIILQHIPIQCTKCVVRGLEPDNDTGEWATEDLDTIHGVIVESDCEILVHKRTENLLIISITLLPNQHRKEKIDLIPYLITKYNLKIKGRSENVDKNINSDDFATTEHSDEVTEVSTCPPESALQLLPETHSSEKDLRFDAITILRKIINGASMISDYITNENVETVETVETDENDETDETHEIYEINQNYEIDKNGNNKTTDADDMGVEDVQGIVILPTANSSLNKSPKRYRSIAVTDTNDTDLIEIEYTCCSSNVDFHLQLQENTHSKNLAAYHQAYLHLMNSLQEGALDQPKIDSFAPDTPCLAQFIDDVWYRCLILEAKQISNSDNIKVKLFYVDYGNEQCKIVDPKNPELYRLTDDWMYIPTQAIKCKLWNLRLCPDIDEQHPDSDIAKLYTKATVAKIKNIVDGIYYVELFEDEEQKVSINNLLIDAGFFEIIDTE